MLIVGADAAVIDDEDDGDSDENTFYHNENSCKNSSTEKYWGKKPYFMAIYTSNYATEKIYSYMTHTYHW